MYDPCFHEEVPVELLTAWPSNYVGSGTEAALLARRFKIMTSGYHDVIYASITPSTLAIRTDNP